MKENERERAFLSIYKDTNSVEVKKEHKHLTSFNPDCVLFVHILALNSNLVQCQDFN